MKFQRRPDGDERLWPDNWDIADKALTDVELGRRIFDRVKPPGPR